MERGGKNAKMLETTWKCACVSGFGCRWVLIWNLLLITFGIFSPHKTFDWVPAPTCLCQNLVVGTVKPVGLYFYGRWPSLHFNPAHCQGLVSWNMREGSEFPWFQLNLIGCETRVWFKKQENSVFFKGCYFLRLVFLLCGWWERTVVIVLGCMWVGAHLLVLFTERLTVCSVRFGVFLWVGCFYTACYARLVNAVCVCVCVHYSHP